MDELFEILTLVQLKKVGMGRASTAAPPGSRSPLADSPTLPLPAHAPARPASPATPATPQLGSKYPVPVILVDYDGFYGGLLQFIKACDANGTVGAAGALADAGSTGCRPAAWASAVGPLHVPHPRVWHHLWSPSAPCPPHNPHPPPKQS